MKHDKTITKCMNALSKYYALNDLRDKADNDGDEKTRKQIDKKCSTAFDKYLEYYESLPKQIQRCIDIYDANGYVSVVISATSYFKSLSK
jgi:hypothetical protein